MDKLHYYKIYYHGEPVGGIENAMTEDEAIVRFANQNKEYALRGLMAVQSS